MYKKTLSLFCFIVFLVLQLMGCTPATNKNPVPVLSTDHITGFVVYSKIADENTSSQEIFLTNLGTGDTIKLTDSENASDPKWSPDGMKILFTTWGTDNRYDINIMNRDGTNKKPILATQANERMPDWSPNGRDIIYVSDEDGNDEIYIVNTESFVVSKLTNSPENESFPAWSADGMQITFVSPSDVTGRLQIFIMDANGKNINQITTYNLDNFDRDPVWCPDNSCIIFTRLSGSAKLVRMDLENLKESYLLGDLFNSKDEGFPSRSSVRGLIPFSIMGDYYAMNTENGEIYSLGVHGIKLSLYP